MTEPTRSTPAEEDEDAPQEAGKAPAPAKKRSLRRGVLRVGGALLALLVVLVLAALVDGWRAFGQAATGARRERMTRSPEWKDGTFRNPQPLVNDAWGSLTGESSPDRSPHAAVPTETVDPKRFAAPPPSGLRVTWLGHSTTLVEIDGARVLTDPIWSERISPVDGVGPTRFFPPLIALADMPTPDAVVISHDHFDHLDFRRSPP